MLTLLRTLIVKVKIFFLKNGLFSLSCLLSFLMKISCSLKLRLMFWPLGGSKT